MESSGRNDVSMYGSIDQDSEISYLPVLKQNKRNAIAFITLIIIYLFLALTKL